MTDIGDRKMHPFILNAALPKSYSIHESVRENSRSVYERIVRALMSAQSNHVRLIAVKPGNEKTTIVILNFFRHFQRIFNKLL